MKSTAEVESLFSQKASSWSQKYAANGPLRYRLDTFGRQLGELLQPPAKVLDFGCGTGNLAGHLNANGFQVSGCDISAKMIEQARENNSGSQVNWHLLPPDWQELPFASNTFDAVVASSAFEYLTEIELTFRECRRVLKPGGYLIATVPNSRKPIRRIENWLRPAAVALGEVPPVKLVPKLASYANYLKCSRNRMALDEWIAIGNKTGFAVVKEEKGSEKGTALAFLRFQKQV